MAPFDAAYYHLEVRVEELSIWGLQPSLTLTCITSTRYDAPDADSNTRVYLGYAGQNPLTLGASRDPSHDCRWWANVYHGRSAIIIVYSIVSSWGSPLHIRDVATFRLEWSSGVIWKAMFMDEMEVCRGAVPRHGFMSYRMSSPNMVYWPARDRDYRSPGSTRSFIHSAH
ncbi:hypothetical protein AB1N83_012988 [Pleurotus pulmonarius]